MFTKGYYVTAELKLKDTSRAREAKQALMELCSETLKEEGCSIFELHQLREDDTRFLLWERFDDEEAFKLHFEKEHTRDYLAGNHTEVVQFFVTDIAS
ncbi:MAG: carboxymuconolactone decarboxylase [Gammaproteobacteria bacterium]|nr:MAG: carboxymuconolactone decarboxylase [Gammaproteobacteria bacterium]